ncbi:hypothetical protein B9Z55_016366 [Caenorhabditis nigoni]|uniref:Uncharacterized protein n=1 Tax=Caenorhabditis nigoni TaxID=1611254 RepID=A0A2G5T4R3_9PELO|nr:hypothetical protein B9Z55_016366 [Caenorhabditis nigoni]
MSDTEDLHTDEFPIQTPEMPPPVDQHVKPERPTPPMLPLLEDAFQNMTLVEATHITHLHRANSFEVAIILAIFIASLLRLRFSSSMDRLPMIPLLTMPCTAYVKLDAQLDGTALQVSQCPVPGCLGWGNTLRAACCYHRKVDACPVFKHMMRKREAPYPEGPHCTPTNPIVAQAPSSSLLPLAPSSSLLPPAPSSSLVAPAPSSSLLPPAPSSSLIPPTPSSSLIATICQQIVVNPALTQYLINLLQPNTEDTHTNGGLTEKEIKQEPL